MCLLHNSEVVPSARKLFWILTAVALICGPPALAAVTGDFNGDGKADVVWRNPSTGQNALWLMNGATVTSAQFLWTVSDPNWQIAGVGDFNGDGKADVVWRNISTGENAVWLMNGTTVTSAQFLWTVSDLNWQIAGVGDFNGDGKADILWRNSSTGQNAVWLMNGASITSAQFLITISDLNWQIVGVGDFNGDGKADILWRNISTGQDALWLMNGASIVSAQFLTTISDLSWQIVGVGDFNGDGKADILWRNISTGQDAAWLMNAATVTNAQFLWTVSDPNWQTVTPGFALLQQITIVPANPAIELGTPPPPFTALGSYSNGGVKALTGTASWSSTNPSVATIVAGNLTATLAGQTTIQASLGNVSGSANLNVSPPGHSLFKNVGLWAQFERRGWPNGYNSGEVIQNWNQFDSVVGSTVAQEVSLQLDKMKAMGINTITYELRAADPTYTGNFTPPDCNIPPVLGFQFPQPTVTELANFPLFLDLVQSKGMKVFLMLNNTHMEQQPPTNNQAWLTAILNVAGNHPAVDLITFGGNTYTVNNGVSIVCGVPAEAPLWEGPGSAPVTYVQWAINLAMSLGIPPRKLSAEAVVGSYFLESFGFYGNLYSPIAVEKGIFDNLGIPSNQRTYTLSFYEHRKCSDAQGHPCTDLDPHDWAEQTLQYVTGVVGTGNGARIVAAEMGDITPVDQVNWNTQHAMESLVCLLHKYGVDGGSFWRWTSFNTSEDSDTTLATPVKQRGVSFAYNPVQKEVLDMGGYHLPAVPNGSFEGPTAGNGVPMNWTASGNGTASQYLLTQEAGQPEVPSRGIYAMRMVTGNGPNDSVTATSVTIPVVPSTLFTTTASLRFSWTGDPNPGGPAASRPQVFVNIFYFQQNGAPSAIRTQDTFAYFQENSTVGFGTFPVQYTTPSDTALVQIQFGASRNGLPAAITLDVDNVR